MRTGKLFFVALFGLAVLVGALADGSGGCKGGFQPDGDGCCPKVINGKAYYRDQIKFCYPRDVGCGVFYADGNGCYPDSNGKYLAAGESCPADRECHPHCIRPNEHHSTTSEECMTTTQQMTTTQERTTTPQRTTTEQRTTTQERTTTPQRTTTQQRTTSPQRTTTEQRTTTQERTTTPQRTTTQQRTTSPQRTTTEECRTTSQEHNNKCSNGQYPDGNGCCPRKIDHQFYYRDGNGCYPIELDCGVFYADGNGCYPDEDGNYLAAGECCPEDRQCQCECDC